VSWMVVCVWLSWFWSCCLVGMCFVWCWWLGVYLCFSYVFYVGGCFICVMLALVDVSAEDLAYANLRFFSEFCWRDVAGQVRNGAFHDEWYELLGGDDRPKRLHIQAAREHAKTTCLSVKYPLWRVGRNPNLRVMIVSKSATLAMTIIREIKANIEGNKRLQAVFPGLQPDSPWTSDELQVKRTPGVILKDATFVGIGLGGSLTGKRADLIIVDDPFDETEVRTEVQREKVEDWIEKRLIPTVTPEGEMVFVGTPWRYDDYWSRLEGKSVENGGIYVVRKYPAIKNYDPELPVEEWDMQWPEVWTPQRMSERRQEIGSVKWACLYLVDPSGLEGTLFKGDWLAYFDPSIFTPEYVRGFEYYMGVDPNVSDDPESDRLAIVTVAFDRARGHIYVLDVFARPMDFPSQLKKIEECGRRLELPFIPGHVGIRKIGIESNMWQQVVSKAAYASGLPIVEVRQKQTKWERMLGLQPHFESGRFKFPDLRFGVNWWDKFESEYLSYPKGRYRDIMDAIEIVFTTADIARRHETSFVLGPVSPRR